MMLRLLYPNKRLPRPKAQDLPHYPGIVPRLRRPYLLVLTVLVLLIARPAYSVDNQLPMKDFYLLPAYCKAKMADLPQNRRLRADRRLPINQAQIDFWQEKIGPDWAGLHNFCAGLIAMSRANDPEWLRKANASARNQFAQAASLIDQSRYDSSPRNPFWFELSIKYAEAIGWAGDYDKASETLAELIALNPKRSEPYILQARLTKRQGELNAAISQLETGLRQGAKAGPLLYYLAEYHYELGDFEQAREYMGRAEAAGMSMERLRAKLTK
jgi:tetratricopeptide (TPR) repeat protein